MALQQLSSSAAALTQKSVEKQGRVNWTDQEITALLTICIEKKIMGMLDGRKHKNHKGLHIIEKRMAEEGFNRNAAQIRDKIKKLRLEFTAAKKRNGTDRKHTSYEHLLEEIFGNRSRDEASCSSGVQSPADEEESVNFAISPQYANSDDEDEDTTQDPMYEGNDMNAFLTGENHMYSQLLASFKTHTQEMLATQNKATLSFIKELNKSNEAMLERMAAAAEADRQHLKSMMKDLGQTMAQTFMQAIPAMMGAFTQGMRQGGFMAQSAAPYQPTNFGESSSIQSGSNFGNAFTFPNLATPFQPSPVQQQSADQRKENSGINES